MCLRVLHSAATQSFAAAKIAVVSGGYVGGWSGSNSGWAAGIRLSRHKFALFKRSSGPFHPSMSQTLGAAMFSECVNALVHEKVAELSQNGVGKPDWIAPCRLLLGELLEVLERPLAIAAHIDDPLVDRAQCCANRSGFLSSISCKAAITSGSVGSISLPRSISGRVSPVDAGSGSIAMASTCPPRSAGTMPPAADRNGLGLGAALVGNPEREHVGDAGLAADADLLAVKSWIDLIGELASTRDCEPCGVGSSRLWFSLAPLLTASSTPAPKYVMMSAAPALSASWEAAPWNDNTISMRLPDLQRLALPEVRRLRPGLPTPRPAKTSTATTAA